MFTQFKVFLSEFWGLEGKHGPSIYFGLCLYCVLNLSLGSGRWSSTSIEALVFLLSWEGTGTSNIHDADVASTMVET